MKQKISYNSIVSGITIAIFVAFIAIFVLFWVFINKPFDDVFFWILVGLFVLCFCCIFGTIPYSVDADDDYVSEYRPFRSRRYRYSDIRSAEPYDRNKHSYEDKGVKFHGKYKEPVLITLKDGSQYVIGSGDSAKLSEYINTKVS